MNPFDVAFHFDHVLDLAVLHLIFLFTLHLNKNNILCFYLELSFLKE